MKNPAPFVREQLFTLLNEAVSYEGSVIPVYDEDEGDIASLKIIMGEQTVGERDDKDSLNHVFDQVIEIVGKGVSKKKVDDVGQLVTDVVLTLTGNEEFQVANLRRPTINYLTEQSGENTLIRRQIQRYNFLIIEK